ncbi:MAG: S8 family serine peptidase [Flavobacterium sp.]|nr:S8 family serine peptidase [Pedobacter sp.]
MRIVLILIFQFYIFSASAVQDPELLKQSFKLPAGVGLNDYLPDRIIVKLKLDTVSSYTISESADILKKIFSQSANVQTIVQLFPERSTGKLMSGKFKSSDPFGLSRLYEVKFHSQENIEIIINQLIKNKNVEYAEPSYIYKTQYIPNDSFFSSRQNYLNQVKAPQAWDNIKNSSDVVIGIVDSGSDLEHPDLAGNIFINTADPVNGLDDDRDGFVDNYQGWDFIGLSASNIAEDNNPDVTSDSTDHGVHISGIASAVSDNAIGVSSIAFNAKLLIVKVGADNNSRSIYRGYEGIKYAVDHGAQIINCSWGGAGGGSFGFDVINYAISKGCLVVAAAGNDNTDSPDYPAAYNGVMSVTSVDNNDIKNSFSNFGASVDLSAPGSNIFSTKNGGNYGIRSGTSMSTPVVSSAAALVKARFPSYDMLQIGEQLRITSDNIDAANPAFAGLLGKGRVNVLRAVTETSPSIRNQKLTIIDKGNGSNPAGDTLSLFFDLKNFLAPSTALTIKLSTANPFVEIIDDQINGGSLGTLQIKNLIGPFRVFVKPNTADNENVEFRLTYSSNGGSYTDFELFNVIVSLDYLNIEVNQVSTTITSIGRVGYNSRDAVNGLGFIYKGRSLLYEASLMVGNSPTQVSNNARNDNGGSDEHFAKKVRVSKFANPEAEFEGRSEFDDSKNPKPLNIYIKHRQLAFSETPDDKYTIAEYEIQNKNSTPLSGLYIGLFSDWDISENNRDITRYDDLNKMGYVTAKAGGSSYGAVKLLKSATSPAYYPLSYQVAGDPLETGGGFSLAEKYETMSGGIKLTGLGDSPAFGYDVMFVLSSGPYTIPANASVKVAFAFIAGDNLQDIQASASSAVTKYNAILNPALLPFDGFVLKQNYPNPATDNTVIEFSIPKASVTSISLYNVLGKRVKDLLNENLREGSYKINVDLSDLKGGIYFYQIEYESKRRSMKMLIMK